MGWGTRLPTSNDPPRDEWEYGPHDPHDDFSALLNGIAFRCVGCSRVTMKHYLSGGRCPECQAKGNQT